MLLWNARPKTVYMIASIPLASATMNSYQGSTFKISVHMNKKYKPLPMYFFMKEK